MRKYASSISSLRSLSICIVMMLLTSALVVAQHAKILHAFGGGPSDGDLPSATLIADDTGNLYGTTATGGASFEGIVFELSPSTGDGPWTETVLYSFTGQGDGGQPAGSLVFDAVGSLYGTTSVGGDSTNCEGGCGTVFELSPPSTKGGNWTETTIHIFGGINDGATPGAGLIFDSFGNLFGTTYGGGGIGQCEGVGIGCGTVFELLPPATQGGAWTETVLYSFTGGADGGGANAPVVMDSTGNLFGTTLVGGSRACQCGTVYELTLSGGLWTETVLHKFGSSGIDGASPSFGGLLLGKSGSLAGTTIGGGTYNGSGTVFGLQPQEGGKWQYAVLYSFGGSPSDGSVPEGVISGGNNVLYGSTRSGGSNEGGTVFQLTRTAGGVWKETGLYSPSNLSNGYSPRAGLLLWQGVLYGTTGQGGKAGDGVVFRISQ